MKLSSPEAIRARAAYLIPVSRLCASWYTGVLGPFPVDTTRA